jgi:hypothetical protein
MQKYRRALLRSCSGSSMCEAVVGNVRREHGKRPADYLRGLALRDQQPAMVA